MMLNEIQKLKVEIMSQGIKISNEAKFELTKDETIPLALFEHHSTTSGIILILPNHIYVNARFLGNAIDSKIKLDFSCGEYFLVSKKKKFIVDIVPLPDYIEKKDRDGLLYREFVITHGDRIRLSPIVGCSFRCRYCDIHQSEYKKIKLERLLKGIEIALMDKNIKPKHLLISGGTPKSEDRKYLDNIYEKVTDYCNGKNIPVDVMLAPRKDVGFLKKLKQWGVDGVAINLEIYNKELAYEINPQKFAISREFYLEFISQAVNIFGRGKVRSLLIVGLEPQGETLAGVEALAKIGCDVALSPFIPFEKTFLANIKAPSIEELEEVYSKSLVIVNKYGVQIGPRCSVCQHNTLAFSDS